MCAHVRGPHNANIENIEGFMSHSVIGGMEGGMELRHSDRPCRTCSTTKDYVMWRTFHVPFSQYCGSTVVIISSRRRPKWSRSFPGPAVPHSIYHPMSSKYSTKVLSDHVWAREENGVPRSVVTLSFQRPAPPKPHLLPNFWKQQMELAGRGRARGRAYGRS